MADKEQIPNAMKCVPTTTEAFCDLIAIQLRNGDWHILKDREGSERVIPRGQEFVSLLNSRGKILLLREETT